MGGAAGLAIALCGPPLWITIAAAILAGGAFGWLLAFDLAAFGTYINRLTLLSIGARRQRRGGRHGRARAPAGGCSLGLDDCVGTLTGGDGNQARGGLPSSDDGRRRHLPRPSRAARRSRTLLLHLDDASTVFRVSVRHRTLRGGHAVLELAAGRSRQTGAAASHLCHRGSRGRSRCLGDGAPLLARRQSRRLRGGVLSIHQDRHTDAGRRESDEPVRAGRLRCRPRLVDPEKRSRSNGP